MSVDTHDEEREQYHAKQDEGGSEQFVDDTSSWGLPLFVAVENDHKLDYLADFADHGDARHLCDVHATYARLDHEEGSQKVMDLELKVDRTKVLGDKLHVVNVVDPVAS